MLTYMYVLSCDTKGCKEQGPIMRTYSMWPTEIDIDRAAKEKGWTTVQEDGEPAKHYCLGCNGVCGCGDLFWEKKDFWTSAGTGICGRCGNKERKGVKQ